jgi:hypothetical protein
LRRSSAAAAETTTTARRAGNAVSPFENTTHPPTTHPARAPLVAALPLISSFGAWTGTAGSARGPLQQPTPTRPNPTDRTQRPAAVASTLQHPKLPPQQFQALFTLFSKSFSSFPHGTCPLSVSRTYLALDGIYHPLGAAFPNNSTRPRRAGRRGFQATDGTLTLHGTVFQRISTRPAG